MKTINAAAAALVLVLSLAGCAQASAEATAKAADKDWKCAACRTSEPVNTAEAIPTTVTVPNAAADIAGELARMEDLGLKPKVINAAGADLTFQYTNDYGAAGVFVSQSPAAGTKADIGSEVTIKVRDPKVVVSADFSGPGGTVTMLEGTSISQITDAPQHWEKVVPYGDSTDYSFTNPYAQGTLTCKITEEGKVVQSNEASGPFASTNC